MTPPLAVNQNNLGNHVVTRTIIWGNLCINAWGSEWNAPDHGVYNWSNGRRMDSTDKNNTGIYNPNLG